MDTVRYGIIGIGNMGSAHALALFEGKAEGAVLAAVADSDEERLAWAKETFKGKVQLFKDYQELLAAADLDTVIIATPHYAHPTIAMQAFKRGLHVLLEKPSGVDAGTVAKMNEEARKSQKEFGIMFNQRTDPLYSALKYYVEIGLLGDIKRTVWIINNWYRSQAYYNSAGWRARWATEGGGVLLNQCPHNLDIWQWIMGQPGRLRAFCKEGRFHDITVEDDVTIYAEYENGATGVFITSTGEYPGTNRLEISGTMGKAVAEDGVLKLFLLDKDERELCFNSPEAFIHDRVTKICLNFPESEDGHILILRNFTRHLLYGDELIAPGYDGIKSLRISNGAYVSSWKEETVELPVSEEVFAEFLKERIEKEALTEKETVKEAGSHDIKGEYSDRWSVRW